MRSAWRRILAWREWGAMAVPRVVWLALTLGFGAARYVVAWLVLGGFLAVGGAAIGSDGAVLAGQLIFWLALVWALATWPGWFHDD